MPDEGERVATNYYVKGKCADACQHCSTSLHLGRLSAGYRFLFRADPTWAVRNLLEKWFERALSGQIESDTGLVMSHGEFFAMVFMASDETSPEGTDYTTTGGHSFAVGPLHFDIPMTTDS
jgi:hypothetical protein